MACSSKPGVKPFLNYIETVTGEKVTQADWHDIRELAAQEYGVEGKLPKKKADEISVIRVFRRLDADLDSYEASYEAYDDAWLELQGKPVTEGTLLTVSYLSRNGVEATLAKVRLARAAKKQDTEKVVESYGDWPSDPAVGESYEGWEFALDYHGSTDQPLACAGLKAVQQRMLDMQERLDGGSEVSDLDVVKGMVAMARIAPFVDEEQYDNVQSALREMEHRFDPALVAVANRQAHHSNQRPSKGLGFKDAQGWGAPIWDDESLNDITL